MHIHIDTSEAFSEIDIAVLQALTGSGPTTTDVAAPAEVEKPKAAAPAPKAAAAPKATPAPKPEPVKEPEPEAAPVEAAPEEEEDLTEVMALASKLIEAKRNAEIKATLIDIGVSKVRELKGEQKQQFIDAFPDA